MGLEIEVADGLDEQGGRHIFDLRFNLISAILNFELAPSS
jgi:hypothetical protein